MRGFARIRNMKRFIASFLMACAIAAPAVAQKHKPAVKAPSELKITSEPNHHLVLQNSYVRVFQVEASPHASTLMHRHCHDYIFVTLGSAEISNEVAGKPPVTLKLQDGETRFVPGNFAHIVRNLSDNPFRNVTIELLRSQKSDQSSQPGEDRSLQVLHGGTEEVLFVKDGVRVSEVELQTAGVEPKHHHAGPRLVVAVSDLTFRNDEVGKPSSNIEMKSGDVKWLEGGMTHTITNVGPTGAKFVMLEF
jgi:quercetin dioxygenase-like cupin family protein